MNIYLESLLFSVILFSLVFVLAQVLRNNSIIDVFWGLSYVLLTIYYALKGIDGWGYIIVVLTSLWGLRLSFYILLRNKKTEDFRYKQFRENWGNYFVVKAFFKIFMLQALLMYMISLTLTYMMNNTVVNQSVVILGVLIWLVGYLFEVVSDNQLKTFKKTNKGLINVGLWKYSRHPNYFGEIVIWIGFFIISLGFGAPVWLIISPLTIFSIFEFITIPILEKKYDGREDYQEYKRITSKLVPKRRKE